MQKKKIKPKSIQGKFLNKLLIILSVSIVLWTFIHLQGEISQFKKESDHLRSEFIDVQKDMIKKEVENVVHYIENIRSGSERMIMENLRQRVNEAHAAAQNIYDQNKESRAPDEIKTMVKDALRPLRFFNGRGYFFAVSLDGTEQLYPLKPEFEGKNLLDLRDEKGSFAIRDEIKIIKKDSEGFVKHYWKKPGKDTENSFLKISFIKEFKPFDWYIGTGEYVDESLKEIQAGLLSTLVNFRFGNEGYFFGSTFDGGSLFSNGKVTAGSGNIWDLTDPGGVKIIQEQSKAAQNFDGGFVSYSWPRLKGESPSPKISFVKGISEWRWTIGAGVYLDDIETEIEAKKAALTKKLKDNLVRSLAVFALLLLLIFFWYQRISGQIKRSMDSFLSYLKKSHTESKSIDTESIQLQEFKEIGIATNSILKDMIDAESALKKSEEKYRLLIENASELVLVSQDGRIRFINSQSVNFLGYQPEEIIGRTFEDFIYPEDRQTVIDRHFRRMKGEKGLPKAYQFRILKKNGDEKWIENNVARIEWDSKPAALSLLTDITDRILAQKEKEKLQEQLAQAHKMESVGRLAGGIAHDFNNMLSIILGNIEIITDDIEPESPFIYNLKEAEAAARRSADLTRQLLAYARKQTILPRILDLNNVIEDTLKLLKRLIGENIELEWTPSRPLCFVKIDVTQISQILSNLCLNARDSIENTGKIIIETKNSLLDDDYCRSHPGAVPGSYAAIRFSDDGCGMDKETLDNLFEPFFTTKKVGEGTGLGLATVYGIVKQNNGFITVDSRPGKGTTFDIFFPCHDAGPEKQQPPKDQVIREGKETILLVEDETSILKMTRMMLERMGYNVIAKESPEEAVEFSSSFDGRIDLLMTDVIMPSINGRDLALQIAEKFPDMKCLFMSGYTADIIAGKGILEKGLNFISKPFSKAELSSRLKTVLD